jgi:hypothetical protein
VRLCVQVECFPLADLLGPSFTRDAERIDFLSLDVEGSEREVIDSFPFDRYDIRVVRMCCLLLSFVHCGWCNLFCFSKFVHADQERLCRDVCVGVYVHPHRTSSINRY